jgi:hypothetical protein
MELQQTPKYVKYIQSLGWKIYDIDKIHIFYRTIPLAGVIAKIQRPDSLPDINKLITVLKNLKVKNLAFEPSPQVNQILFTEYINEIKKAGFHINASPFLPTKTLIVDLIPDEDKIFTTFSEAKRRAVRRAIKNNVRVEQSNDVKILTSIKNKSAGFLGFITTFGIDKLWPILAPDLITSEIAYSNKNKIVGGVLLVFNGDTSYYWIAGATREGKKLFAPTLLAWEAMKLSKNLGYKKFDFVGVWDERIPKNNLDWLGFTKFKEGFGTYPIYYPLANL